MLEYNKIKSSDLGAAAMKVQKALEGMSDNLAISACLANAIIIQDPDLSVQKLSETIKTVSEYLALALSSNNDPKVN